MRACLLVIACLVGFTKTTMASDYGITVTKAGMVSIGNTYYLGADIDYRFNPPAIDALERGVPLTLAVKLVIRRLRHFWFDDIVINEERKIQIRYHPLAQSFQIVEVKSGATQNFTGLTALLDTLSRLRGWEIASMNNFKPEEHYEGSLSVHLDIESLPLPLRAQAYLSPRWHIHSPVYSWPLDL